MSKPSSKFSVNSEVNSRPWVLAWNRKNEDDSTLFVEHFKVRY